MWMMELTTNTATADTRIGSHRAVNAVIEPPDRGTSIVASSGIPSNARYLSGLDRLHLPLNPQRAPAARRSRSGSGVARSLQYESTRALWASVRGVRPLPSFAFTS